MPQVTQLATGQVLITETSRCELRVGPYLGGGGQGEVYRAKVHDHEVALKWYFPQTATSMQRSALELLVQSGSPDDRFLWPLELVTNPAGKGFGYFMALREPRFRGLQELVTAKIRPKLGVKCDAAYHLVDGYFKLHMRGWCYRDISFGNVFLEPKTGEVLICDNDNVGVNNSAPPTILGSPKFMAPEIVRREHLPNRDTDLFSLSVLLFYMFVANHPLDGKHESAIKCFSPSARERLYGREPLFIFDPKDRSNEPDPEFHSNAVNLWPMLPRFFQAYFTRAFTDGLTDAKNGRVQENEWRKALVRLRDSIMHCSHCNSEMFYDHDVYNENRGSLNSCLDCRKVPELPPRMRIDGRKTVIVLDQGSRICPHHIMRLKEFDFSRELATVVRHPQDPAKIGLKNLSDEKWVVTGKDGSAQEVSPGTIMQIVEGIKVNFAGLTGEFRIKG